MENHIKYIIRLKIETTSAMRVGSGEKGLVMDRLIARDVNELPYIPGTSLAGVVRHSFEDENRFDSSKLDDIFGYQSEKEDDGKGSRIIFSSAYLIGTENQVHEGIENIDFKKEYYRYSKQLAERDHVRIDHRGTAMKHNKYEEELVRKGTRFVFEIEMEGTEEENDFWKKLIDLFHEPTFRIGSGTRKGLGAFKVVECQTCKFDLEDETQLKKYLKKSSSLSSPLEGELISKDEMDLGENWQNYTFHVKPKDFFLFGAGVGDIDKKVIAKFEAKQDLKGYTQVDNSPKTEEYFYWGEEGNGPPVLKERYSQLLIPATSVKGALSHRTAFHYNKSIDDNRIENMGSSNITEIEKDSGIENWDKMSFGFNPEDLSFESNSSKWDQLIQEIEGRDFKSHTLWKIYENQLESKSKLLDESVSFTGEENEAVKALFGYAKQAKNTKERKTQEVTQGEDGARGSVIISDVYKVRKEENEKIFNHVAIDRFTGGGIDGALFQEKVVHTQEEIKIEIFVEKNALQDEKIKAAFEAAIDDLKTGKLQLGGNTTKGHGVFQAVGL